MKAKLRIIKYIITFLIGFPMIYFLMALILGHAPMHKDFKEDSTGVEIFIKSNGVHTDFVVPRQNEICNWDSVVSVNETIAKDSNAKYVAFGWGDKGFFIDTPEWKDLKFSVAFKSVFALSTTAMHVSYRSGKPLLNEDCKSVYISKVQYKTLVLYINNSFQKDSLTQKTILIPKAHYHNYDAFYEAKGKYSLFKTCNEWTRKGMSTSGIKCPMWSVLPKSVLRYVK